VRLSNTLYAEHADGAVERVAVDPEHLHHTLSELARTHQVPGAQLAIYDGGETVAIEVGELEYGTGRPITRDAAFPVGSITKTFTAAMAMILVADGDLELDAPLGEHMPELDTVCANLSLRQILSHTSGFASDTALDEPSSVSIRRCVLDHCRREKMVLPSGTGFSYSNIGYVLTGHLIEHITGMSWWEALESILLQPLGIDPTFIAGSSGSRLSSRPIVTGHSVNTAVGRTRPVRQTLEVCMAPAGALAVSAVDLVRLGLTQLDGQAEVLLPAAYAAKMRQFVPCAEPFGLADGWGLGLALFRNRDTVWVGHDGNADGTACYLRVDPQNSYVVAFTSNATIGLAMWQELVTKLEKMGLSIGNYSTAETLGRPAAAPVGCEGSYMNGDSEYYVQAQRDGRFFLLVDGEAVARLSFYDDLLFSHQDLDSGKEGHVGRFLRNSMTGDIDQMQANGRLARRRIGPPSEDGSYQSLKGVPVYPTSIS
jgi:CubicO group peptidase (beta-lactamase class C family)